MIASVPVYQSKRTNRIDPDWIVVRSIHGIADMKYRTHAITAISRETGNLISACSRSFPNSQNLGWRMIRGSADRVSCETCLTRERKRKREARETERIETERVRRETERVRDSFRFDREAIT